MSQKRPFIGSSVVNGQIRYSSVSQIKLFDPASDGCNRKWVFQYKFGKKLAKTNALDTGIDNAEKLEHYLKTSENVLPPLLQPAQKFFPVPGPDLEVEQPLGDIEKAVYFRDQILKPGNETIAGELVDRMKRFAGLTACNVPLEGAADFRHRRGEYIDEEGVLRPESVGAVVVETGDLKTTARIWSKTTAKGKILPGWAKTSAQVCADTQMVGYARAAIDKYPEATHHRLSHIYAAKESKGAAKRTGLISVAQVLERWHGVENVVAQMVQAAMAQKIEDVEPNINACDSYTHVSPEDGKTTLRGCGHRYYCPIGIATFQNMLGQYKESAMSLFDTLAPSALPAGMTTAPTTSITPLTPSAPPLDAIGERALIEAEKTRLRAQDVSQPPVCVVCSAPSTRQVQNLRGTFLLCATCEASAVLGVTPPDAPSPAPLLHAAAPLPSAAMAEIIDPKLRQTVEQHAAEHKRLDEAHAAQEQAEKVAAGTNVWCSESSQRITLTMDMALARKYTCSCTKTIALKPAKQEDGTYQATLPRHKPTNKPEAPPPVLEATTPPPPFETPNNGGNGHKIVVEEINDGSPPDGVTIKLLKSIDNSLRELLVIAHRVKAEAELS